VGAEARWPFIVCAYIGIGMGSFSIEKGHEILGVPLLVLSLVLLALVLARGRRATTETPRAGGRDRGAGST
jgi:uncharacterized membrane protein YfcA